MMNCTFRTSAQIAAVGVTLALMPAVAFAQAPSLVPPPSAAPPAAAPKPAAPKPAAPKPAAPKPAAAAPTAAPNLPPVSAAMGAAVPANNGPKPEWMKVCGKDDKQKTELCSVSSYIQADAGNVVGEIRLLDVKRDKESKRIIEALIPPGFLIPPGVNLVIDDAKQPITGRYRVCYQNVCLAEVQVTDETLAAIRKGSMLTFFAANAQGQWVGAKASLAGFSSSYDGPSLDPKVYEEKRKSFEEGQNKLQSELMKRAEEQRKKLQDGVPAAAAQPAPGEPVKTQ
ncbi:invasion associated locus B family protein [Flaviflagellibacter deserti]|uniref:Invasion associated locus B family protein n=1 Tax=Flaviflagellibacter deserti TaxID=2267266 RepID=A0ABV9Z1I5_9HYPH